MNNSVIVPFSREGVTLKIVNSSGKLPDFEQANSMIACLHERWDNGEKDEYIKKVINALDKKAKNVVLLQDSIFVRYESGIIVMDCPLIQFDIDGHTCQARISDSICIAKKSTKIWSRVGQTETNSGKIGFLTDEYFHYRNIFSGLNRLTSWWMKNLLDEIIQERFSDFSMTQLAWLEVSSFGIKDADLKPHFDKLSDTTVKISQLLLEDKARELFKYYFDKILKCQEDLLDYINNGEKKYLHWLSLPISIEVDNGYVEPREVLFCRKMIKNKVNDIKYMGIAYDDSAHRNLSHWAVREMVDYVGKVED